MSQDIQVQKTTKDRQLAGAGISQGSCHEIVLGDHSISQAGSQAIEGYFPF